ncbi:MAG: rhodanese-like domain-containing protein [Paludibacter sp.]|nr:rhodanese-like domain-containing protein [Paludibacter sp.]
MNKIIFFTITIMISAACSTQTKTETKPLEQIALSDSTVIVDVRTPEEFATGHIEKSINIPLDVIAVQNEQLRDYQSIITVCRSGVRSGKAKAILEGLGFKNVFNGGGWQSLDDKMKKESK